MLTWKWCTFQSLTLQELYDLLALRQEVFTVEQKCTENDLDYHDQEAWHLLGYQDNKLVAYLRLFLEGKKYPDAVAFGRVLTDRSLRGQGVGHELMKQVLLFLQNQNNISPIIISAQLYLEKFYCSYGFEIMGEPYDEGGIPHIKMLKASSYAKK